MLNKRLLLVSFLLLAGFAAASAQSTPYGRFGYGELSSPAFGAGRAMGGIGFGIRDPKLINPLNPASYSSVDSLSFLFDVGAHISTAWYKEGANRATTFSGNLDYVGLEFRLLKGLGISIGLMPFSTVSYQFGATTTESGITRTDKYSGEGGFSKLYLGLGYSLFKNFSLGANVSYFFGNTTYTTNTVFSGNINNVNLYQKLKASDVTVDLGLQYVIPVSEYKDITVGVVYSPKMALNTTLYDIEQVGDSVRGDTIRGLGFDLPQSFGGGVSFSRKNRFMVGADVLFQQWSKARFYETDEATTLEGINVASLRNRLRVALGGQYIPKYNGRIYLGRVRYRLGAYYANSYFNMKNASTNEYYGGTKEFGISAGFGFPLLDSRSVLNLSFDYVSILPERKNLVEEQYFKITISYTMNEQWFRKRKLE